MSCIFRLFNLATQSRETSNGSLPRCVRIQDHTGPSPQPSSVTHQLCDTEYSLPLSEDPLSHPRKEAERAQPRRQSWCWSRGPLSGALALWARHTSVVGPAGVAVRGASGEEPGCPLLQPLAVLTAWDRLAEVGLHALSGLGQLAPGVPWEARRTWGARAFSRLSSHHTLAAKLITAPQARKRTQQQRLGTGK